jgi:hypothetical protein
VADLVGPNLHAWFTLASRLLLGKASCLEGGGSSLLNGGESRKRRAVLLGPWSERWNKDDLGVCVCGRGIVRCDQRGFGGGTRVARGVTYSVTVTDLLQTQTAVPGLRVLGY